MDKLLTTEELANRWQVSTQSIDKWRKEGVISPVKGLPVIRFTMEHIAEIEGVKLEQVSPLKYKRLLKDYEKLKEEAENLKDTIRNILIETTKIINL